MKRRTKCLILNPKTCNLQPKTLLNPITFSCVFTTVVVEFFYCHFFYFGEFVCDKRNVAGVARFAAERDGRHVRGVSFQENLVERHDGGGVTYALRVVERDDSRKANENVCIEGEESLDKFRCAGKAMNVDVAVMQVCGAEHGECVFISFAEVQYERLAAFYA